MDDRDDATEDPPTSPSSTEGTGPLPSLPNDFPVVGIGSSAGGLDALSRLLGELPPDPGLAIIIVTHGDPEQESQLVDLLDRITDMDVTEAQEGMQIQRNRVHVVPPGFVPEIHEDRLEPLEAEKENISHAIDRFLRSLSDVYRAHAVGVVLSGSLSDGAQGLQAIQRRGGISIVQDPEGAEYTSMPTHAIEAGHVDHVLAPEEIATELARVREHWAAADEEGVIDDDTLAEVFERVRDLTGVDFARYKRSTLVRRIQRRMIATRTRDLETYLTMLDEDPEEVWRLHDESLIHVTEFFRDRDVFDALKEALPELLAEGEGPVRVWVPGCATGEEVYSLAMIIAEVLDEQGLDRGIQLFGTDLSERAIEVAREARYPKSIGDSVDERRLRRFFVEEEGAYRVRDGLREACVFARHDLLKDPPFSELDLVSCRNVLIYLHPDHQEDVAETLHYALGDEGALVLGASESIQRYHNLFEPWIAEHNIYRPTEASQRLGPVTEPRPGFNRKRIGHEAGMEVEQTEADLRREVDRVALELYAPPVIVLDGNLEVVEFRGDVSAYLDPQQGRASLDVMRIAPHGLAVAIRSAVDEIRSEGGPIRETDVGFERAGTRREVDLRVVPVLADGGSDRYFLVAFEEDEEGEERLLDRVGGVIGDLFEPQTTGGERAQELEEELEATRSYLQSVIEDYEATNEELRSAHEEALSTNEELQSTNEELETTKEELESTNEELNRVNEELRERNRELEKVNTDLVNVFEGLDLPIVMLDGDLRIRRFTPQAGDLVGLIDADVGRPLEDLSLPFDDADLPAEIRTVLAEGTVHRMTLTGTEGRTYRLRISPYRTNDDEVDGTVLVFWDVEGSPQGT